MHDEAVASNGGMTEFAGAKARYTESLSFLTPSSKTEGIPVYRVMDKKGDILVPESDPNLPDEQLLKMYKVRYIIYINLKIVLYSLALGIKHIVSLNNQSSFLGND